MSKVGVVLGSGSSRGWSHIGVLKALHDYDRPVDMITGASIGAFVGAVYAAGKLESLEEFALSMDWKKIISYMDVVFPKSGFLEGKKVAEMLAIHTDITTFEDLSLPLQVVATDIMTGERVVFKSGNLVDAIRASVAVPGIVSPMRIKGRWLVDGGLVDPVPVSVMQDMGADVIIAVDLNESLNDGQGRRDRRKSRKKKPQIYANATSMNPNVKNEFITRLAKQYGAAEKIIKQKLNQLFTQDERAPHIIDIMGSTVAIMQQQIARRNLDLNPPDILIRPSLGNLKMFDFDEAEQAIKEGYECTLKQMDQIRKKIGEL